MLPWLSYIHFAAACGEEPIPTLTQTPIQTLNSGQIWDFDLIRDDNPSITGIGGNGYLSWERKSLPDLSNQEKYEESEAILTKYNQAEEQIWTRQFSFDQDDIAKLVGFDRVGNAYRASAKVRVEDNWTFDAVIIRFNSAGEEFRARHTIIFGNSFAATRTGSEERAGDLLDAAAYPCGLPPRIRWTLEDSLSNYLLHRLGPLKCEESSFIADLTEKLIDKAAEHLRRTDLRVAAKLTEWRLIRATREALDGRVILVVDGNPKEVDEIRKSLESGESPTESIVKGTVLISEVGEPDRPVRLTFIFQREGDRRAFESWESLSENKKLGIFMSVLKDDVTVSRFRPNDERKTIRESWRSTYRTEPIAGLLGVSPNSDVVARRITPNLRRPKK